MSSAASSPLSFLSFLSLKFSLHSSSCVLLSFYSRRFYRGVTEGDSTEVLVSSLHMLALFALWDMGSRMLKGNAEVPPHEDEAVPAPATDRRQRRSPTHATKTPAVVIPPSIKASPEALALKQAEERRLIRDREIIQQLQNLIQLLTRLKISWDEAPIKRAVISMMRKGAEEAQTLLPRITAEDVSKASLIRDLRESLNFHEKSDLTLLISFFTKLFASPNFDAFLDKIQVLQKQYESSVAPTSSRVSLVIGSGAGAGAGADEGEVKLAP